MLEPIVPYQQSLAATPLTERVANGHPAAANQFPYQVAVTAAIFGGPCGGSLISNAWVLCAAHCTFFGTQHNLRFGSLNWMTGGLSQASFYHINHPDFNPSTLNNDISLLSVPSPLTFTAAIQPIRLPTAAQVATTFTGAQATVSGWGETFPGSGPPTLLRWVHMRVIPNAQCTEFYSGTFIVDHVVCAMGYTQPENQGHCTGDSGGPLTILEGATRTQIGVVSFSAGSGCNAGFPSGYMRTANFVHWINQNTGIPVRAA